MTPTLNIKRVENCLEWLETVADDYRAVQSIAWFIDQIGVLCKTLAFVNGQMAVAKEKLNDRKVKAYETLIASSVANETYFAPSLAKDYIAAKCKKEQYQYDMCERCSRTVTHQLEMLRSILSALKEESKTLNYHS